MTDEIITRAALGRSAGLGELYNVRSDSFCGSCIFDGAIPTETITSFDASFCDIKLIHTDNLSEKFKNLGVEGELQASIIANLVTLEGAGKYISDGKESARSVKMSLVYNTMTINESIFIYCRKYDNLFSTDAIEDKMGTHVVIGISWGASLILSVSYANKESHDETKISGNSQINLKKLCTSIIGKAEADYSEKDKNFEMKFNFHICGDVLPNILPTDLDSARELMKKFPSLVEHVNGGKGRPLSFTLLPISTVQKHRQLRTSTSTCIRSFEERSLMRIVKLTEQISAAKQNLYDFLQDALSFKFCITEAEIEEISNFRDEIEIQEAEFRNALSSVLTEVRSGNANSQELESLISKFYEKNTSPENVRMKISGWSSISEKIGFVQSLLPFHVKYVGYGCSYHDEITKELDRPLMILFFSKHAKLKDPEKWIGNKRLFSQELSSQDNRYKYLAVDCDIHPNLQIANETSCIQIVLGGKIIVQNFLAEEEKLEDVALAYSESGSVRQSHLPNNRVQLSIKCVGNSCNPNIAYDWVCKKCKAMIEYGFDKLYVYCECGKSPVDKLVFKCPDPKHGIRYIPHKPAYLQEQLATVRPYPELNILILGETGVGKSTFINGFCNYTNYETLGEAEHGKLHSLIPSKFTVYDGGKEITVTTGEDANEEHNAGQSATQTTKVYQFTVGKTTIRLIDTPGIGDTRGIEQDEKNVENILGTISHLEEIHGILILLKPNQSRISIAFRFCIKQLLTNLHKDASENISFCFTNSRSTFYRPGDTMTPLKALLQEIRDVKIPLNEHTIFCFDSEAYRYLSAIKNTPPVKFHEDERKTFEASWETSVKEVNRLIEHILKVKPHVTKSTISLNKTRQLVLQLSRPLAEINRNIQMNKAKVEEDKEEIERTDEDTKKLEGKLMMTRTEIETKKIDHPRTVCGHIECKKIRDLNGSKTTDYITICHKECSLKGIPADTLGDSGLMNCLAFHGTEGFCRNDKCKHHYRNHLHIYYDSIQVQKLVRDESVAESLKKKLDARQMKQAMIDDKNREIEEYENELNFIETACAKFACFLKCNAIAPYNDALLDYLDYLISEEKSKVAAGCRKTTLKNLQKSKSSYMEQKHILEESMKKGNKQDTAAQLGPEQMENLVKELKDLQHSGKAITEALDCVRYAKIVDYKEVPVPPKKKRNFLKALFGKA